MELHKFIKNIPKAELHLHIEGSLEPELMFKIAQRNNLKLKYDTVEELQVAYDFHNLQDFLDIYYEGAGVLLYEQDFYDMTWAYLEKAVEQGVEHTEIFFDPQTHTGRGVEFEVVINGIDRALKNAKTSLGISSKLIMCFLRHLSEDAAMKVFDMALPFKNKLVAVGLDSSEVGHPPSKFERVFSKAREEGLLTVAHAGEEGPAEYVWEALKILKVSRIDHGNHSLDDPELVKELVESRMPLTVCPLSNLKLKVVSDLKNHPLRDMMKMGLNVTINSDDPSYFGGYVSDNYEAIATALDLSYEEIVQLAKNSFRASFLSPEEKKKFLNKIEKFYESR